MGWKAPDDSVEDIVKRFRRFNMSVKIDLIRKAAKAMAAARSEESKKTFRNIIKQFEVRTELLRLKTDKPFIEVPEESAAGDIVLGSFMQGGEVYHECRVAINDLIMSCVNAAPNKGKTNLLFHICREIDEYNKRNPERKICLIVLDRKKDFRNLPIPAAVLDIQDVRINFFDAPPNSDSERWISDISNALMHAWGWMFASRNYFMHKVYELWQHGRTPTLYEVFEEIRKDKEAPGRITNRQMEIQEVNLDRIQAALREFGKCLSARRTFQLHEFIESGTPLVIEADVSPDSYAILFSWLLLYIYRLNKDNDVRGNLSNGGVMIVADESYLLWEIAKDHSEARRELGANFISLAPLYLRDFRTCIIAASQRPLSPDYMSAANTRIVGYTGDYKDAQYCANSLGDPDLLQTIMKLGVGEFLIKIGERDAALVKVPHVPFERISDEAIAAMMKPYREAIIEYCREEQEKEKKEEPRFRISEETKALLRNVCDYPDATISFRYEKLGWKTSAAQQHV